MSKNQEQKNQGKVIDSEITLVCENCGEPVMHYLTIQEIDGGEFYSMCPNCEFCCSGTIEEDELTGDLNYEAVFS